MKLIENNCRDHEDTKSRRITKKRFSFSCFFVVFVFSWLHLSFLAA